jgi:hypothetical protein
MRAADEPQSGPSTRKATRQPTDTSGVPIADLTVHRRRSESSNVAPSPVTLDGLPLMLTIAEAAVVLRVSRTTAYKLAEEWRTSGGRSGMPVVNLGRRLVVRRVDLATLVGLPPVA